MKYDKYIKAIQATKHEITTANKRLQEMSQEYWKPILQKLQKASGIKHFNKAIKEIRLCPDGTLRAVYRDDTAFVIAYSDMTKEIFENFTIATKVSHDWEKGDN